MSAPRRPPVPPGLSPEARRFFRDVSTEYAVTDPGGLRLLRTASEALDLMRAAQAVVARDGLTTTDRYGAVRAHPMLAVVRDSRTAMLAAIRQMGLDIEPLQPGPGRPPGR